MYTEYPTLEMNTHLDAAGVAELGERTRKLGRSPSLIQHHWSPVTKLVVGALMVLGMAAMVNLFVQRVNADSLDIDPFAY
jgi:hypothetical protein